jgi:hypothetical protein
MLKMVALLPNLPLFLMVAVVTHLVMSFAQTLMHYKLGHHPLGGRFFRNHIHFHHTYYAKDHLVSPMYLGDEGNNTPFFLIPVLLVGACTYAVLRLASRSHSHHGLRPSSGNSELAVRRRHGPLTATGAR